MASRGATLRGALSIPGAARPTPAPQGSNWVQQFNNGRGMNAPSIGQISPLAAQLANESGYANTYGPFLPRPTNAFTEGAFGPFSPILPVPVDKPEDGLERPEGRRFQYPVGWNLPTGSPGLESMRMCSFETMGKMADVYSIARACVEFRKNQIRGIEWDITPTPDAQKAYQNSPAQMADFGKRRAKVMKFFQRPDINYLSYSSWISTVMEEIVVYDALSLLIKPSRVKGKGVLGSNLSSLMTIHGPTVRPLLDLHGGTPRPPAPAYQQYIYGVPRADFMTMILQMDIDDANLTGTEVAQFRGDQLLYLPMIPRAWTPYGFSAVERALIPIMTGLQKQSFQYDVFSESCYDDQTEVLTRDGWKFFEKVTEDDLVATRSEAGDFEWQHPSMVWKFWHDSAVKGKLVHFNGVRANICVTQNHRMLVKRTGKYITAHPGCGNQDWEIKEAGYWVENPTTAPSFEVPVTSVWPDGAVDRFTLPGHESNRAEYRAIKCAQWLHSMLVNGPERSSWLMDAGAREGFSTRQLYDARKVLNCVINYTSDHGRTWVMPIGTLMPELPEYYGRPWPSVSIPMDAFCAFLGLFISEGWVGTDNASIIIAQYPTSRHLDDIKEILRATGLHWQGLDNLKPGKAFKAHNVTLGRWLKENCGHRAWNKHIPQDVKNLPRQYLVQLMRSLIIGDGGVSPSGLWTYTTSSKVLADDVQELTQKTGSNCYISYHPISDVETWYDRHPDATYKPKRKRDIYTIHQQRGDARALKVPSLVDYKGYVGCVTVPNGIVYVRRNGRAAWCGNTIPAAYVIPGDTAMTPNQLRELQDALNAIAGDPAWKQKIIVLPPGSHIEPQKQISGADELDQWITQEVCMGFGLSPMEIGVTPGRSGSSMGASGGAENQMAKMRQSTSEDTGLTPILKFLSDIFNSIIVNAFGQTDMLFTFEGLQQEEDQDALTGVLVQQFQNGMRTLDECRQELNLQPFGIPETSEPLIVTPNGVMPISTAVDSAINQAKQQAAATAAQAGAAGAQAAQSQAQTQIAQEQHNVAMNAPAPDVHAQNALTQARAQGTQEQNRRAEEQHSTSMNAAAPDVNAQNQLTQARAQGAQAQNQRAEEQHNVEMNTGPADTSAQNALARANTARVQEQTASAQAANQRAEEQHNVAMNSPGPDTAGQAAQNRARTAQTEAQTANVRARTQMAQESHEASLNAPLPGQSEADQIAQARQRMLSGQAQQSGPDMATTGKGSPTQAAAAAANNEMASAQKSTQDPVIFKRSLAEYEALARHLAKGRPVSTWDARFISQGVLADVAKGMAEGLDPRSAVAVAKVRAGAVQNAVQLPQSEYEWVEKVGKEGYIHGWVCVKPPCGKAHDLIMHPDHGTGMIGSVDDDGKQHAFFADGTQGVLGDQGDHTEVSAVLRQKAAEDAEKRRPKDFYIKQDKQLTELERMSRDGYLTEAGNRVYNDPLRQGKKPSDAHYNLDSAISKSSAGRDGYVYRGLALQEGTDLSPGIEFTDHAYMSTTGSREKAKEFADARAGQGSGNLAQMRVFGGKPVVVRIPVKEGDHIMRGDSSVDEYVLPRGQRYRVTSVDDDGTVNLERSS